MSLKKYECALRKDKRERLLIKKNKRKILFEKVLCHKSTF